MAQQRHWPVNYLRIDYSRSTTPRSSSRLKPAAVVVSPHHSDPTRNSPSRTAATNGAALIQNVVKDRRKAIGLII
jgi:hypothetical protein